MKISCVCGHATSDSADALPYKAHVIPDQDLVRVSDSIDTAGDRAHREILRNSRTIYQCYHCDRLMFTKGDDVLFFTPDGPGPASGVLTSVLGAKRKGSLSARWFNGKGDIFWSVGIDDSGWDDAFDSWEALESRYRAEFARLSEADLLDRAILRRDGVDVHVWKPDSAPIDEQP